MTRALRLIAVVVGLGLTASVAAAGELRAAVQDLQGAPLEDAVVVAVAKGGGAPPPPSPGRQVMDQIDREFVPYVKAVQVGSAVFFPNKDNIRHHVYSFSPAKRFELPLYVGTPASPVVFDKPGVVTIGCNIHDWMIAYIYVSESPYFGTTDKQGLVKLENLPAGAYGVHVWHPLMEGTEAATTRAVTVGAAGTVELRWSLGVRPDLRSRRAPVVGPRGYR